ncbi:MAG: ribokinase [Chloroflexota bacterium]|nr:MAG: ribokinase [Chloroflexota bacterium]
MSTNIAVVGGINIDLVTRAAHIPRPGETVIGGDLSTVPGGKGANQAVAAARLGAHVSMIGRVGDDVFAAQLRQNLAAANVDLTHVLESVNSATGVALIVVDEAGENSIVVALGANAKVTPDDVEAASGAVAAADALLLQLEIPLDPVLRAAELAHDHGVKVILNPAPARALPAEFLSLVDILVPNETETAQLSGMPTGSPAELEVAAARLHDLGVGEVILTLGRRGALLARQGTSRHYPAFEVERVVDTTAAGDAFMGGLATAIAEGKDLSEALPWANAAGGLAVTRAGAQPSLPTRQEVEALLAQATPEQLQGVQL